MLDAARIRGQFPALARTINGREAVFLDGPAGTQVPRRVIQAISDYLTTCNANHGGLFLTSRESDAWVDRARQACADFVGAADSDCVVFGPNMTSLTFSLSRAIARQWRTGDEVIVSDSDHDANVTPWVRAAEDAGALVRRIPLRAEDGTLDLETLARMLSARTRLVTVGCASNATGTIHPVERICAMARQAGALTYLDAVHYAPHGPIDVDRFGCDFLVCSAYKFFGPHVGILWGRRELLEGLPAYKVRPASNGIPDRWMTGTPNSECIAGTLAAVEYLADLAELPTSAPLRQRLLGSFAEILPYERELGTKLIAGLGEIPGLKVWGITDPARFDERVPTVSITIADHSPTEIARHLADDGIFAWHGNFYALPLTEALGLEPAGMVRLGLVHYNTAAEVDRVLESLGRLTSASR